MWATGEPACRPSTLGGRACCPAWAHATLALEDGHSTTSAAPVGFAFVARLLLLRSLRARPGQKVLIQNPTPTQGAGYGNSE